MKKQCTKCNKWIWVNTSQFNGEIPKHVCIDDEQVINDEMCSISSEIATVEIASEVYDSSNDNSSNTDTSSSDIGGGGDFGGGGTSNDY
jgi:uncharacterized membrane protein YgcG